MRQLENICHWLTVMAPAQVVEAEGPAARAARRAAPAAAAVRRLATVVDAAARGARPPAAVPRCPPAPRRRRATAAPPRRRPAGSPSSSARRARCCEAGAPEVWDTLTRKFEAQLIHTALEITRGRRIEAAQKLGIGRNTITRKIQELGLDD